MSFIYLNLFIKKRAISSFGLLKTVDNDDEDIFFKLPYVLLITFYFINLYY